MKRRANWTESNSLTLINRVVLKHIADGVRFIQHSFAKQPLSQHTRYAPQRR